MPCGTCVSPNKNDQPVHKYFDGKRKESHHSNATTSNQHIILEYHKLKQFKSNGNQAASLHRNQLLLHLFIVNIYGKCIKLSYASQKNIYLFSCLWKIQIIFDKTNVYTYFSIFFFKLFFREMHGMVLCIRQWSKTKTEKVAHCTLHMCG